MVALMYVEERLQRVIEFLKSSMFSRDISNQIDQLGNVLSQIREIKSAQNRAISKLAILTGERNAARILYCQAMCGTSAAFGRLRKFAATIWGQDEADGLFPKRGDE